jgi:hypothetical protein
MKATQITDESFVAQYLELCSGSPDSNLAKKIASCQREVEKAQMALFDKMRALETVERESRARLGLQSAAQSREEASKLLQDPSIESIQISGSIITVTTKPISVEHDGHAHVLGTFRIDLRTEPYKSRPASQSYMGARPRRTTGSTGLIRMVNLTKKVSVDGLLYDHPHVCNEIPCLGNLQNALPYVVASRQYAAAISLCIQYLKSYNANDELAPAPRFWQGHAKPAVPKKRKRAKKKSAQQSFGPPMFD